MTDKHKVTEERARALSQELKKFLTERGIWFSVKEVNKGELDVILFEASIKVCK